MSEFNKSDLVTSLNEFNDAVASVVKCASKISKNTVRIITDNELRLSMKRFELNLNRHQKSDVWKQFLLCLAEHQSLSDAYDAMKLNKNTNRSKWLAIVVNQICERACIDEDKIHALASEYFLYRSSSFDDN